MLYCGRIEPKKNLAFMAHVQREVSRVSSCRFVTVGPAEAATLSHVHKVFRQCGAEQPLNLPGTGDDGCLRAAYSAADVFVLPSHHENFSNVVVEAALCGTPVIASPNVGVAHAMAILGCAQVQDLRASDWASAILASGRSRLGPCSVQRLAETFSPASVARSLVDLYKRVQRPQSNV
jgi:glycosyltransferase involved in cell wall biosynthesis